MRLLSVELAGFRGFPRRQIFDLDADAVVLVGANGHGKTSLFDGILWALSGRIPRLHSEDSRLVSMYSETGQARVALRLQDPRRTTELTVTRSFDGSEGRLTLDTSEGSYTGPSAEGRLIDLVWPDAASASDPREALASVLTCSVYLQQDLIRQFVEAATDQERFAAVSELVGAGRVTELQASLERAKKAWSTTTNQREDELDPLRNRLAEIEARQNESAVSATQASSAITAETWDQWWLNLSRVGLTVLKVDSASREAPAAIDNSIKQLEALRRSTERRLQSLHTIRTELLTLLGRTIPDALSLRPTVALLRDQLEDLRRSVAQEQVVLAELRRHQAELKEKAEQLRALATLALKHLEDRCPVCAQAYDVTATKLRLEAIAKGGGEASHGGQARSSRLGELLAALATKEKETATAELTLRSTEQAAREQQTIREALSKRLTEFSVTTDDDVARDAALEQAIASAEDLVLRVRELQGVGESLALRLAHSSAQAVLDELHREAETLRRDIADREQIILARNQTGNQAQHVIEALREAAGAVVEERLQEIGPLLQSIYARIDPHPSLRLVTFLSRMVRGKGQLSTVVIDPIGAKESTVPATVLSSSQVNALAASVFLALNMGMPRPPLSVAILDDPLQSLDDINLLGLVDLLRRTKDRRQLLVSTHDSHFGSLLSRKLRPISDAGRTLVIELSGWSRQGPTVMRREVKSDPVPLRLVVA